MDDMRQAAYRHLLYVAMIDFRNYSQPRARVSYNPIVWYRHYHQSRIAGAVADWLHNLANVSSKLQHGFAEESFWNEHTMLCQRYPHANLERYREAFERYLPGQMAINSDHSRAKP
jgi:hypothetical protein